MKAKEIYFLKNDLFNLKYTFILLFIDLYSFLKNYNSYKF